MSLTLAVCSVKHCEIISLAQIVYRQEQDTFLCMNIMYINLFYPSHLQYIVIVLESKAS